MRLPSKRSKHSNNRRGVEAVEFAMVMPVMLLLTFGAIDYGWYFWNQALATNAVLAGMRTGGMTTPSEIENENGGECAQCTVRAANAAVANLADIGITVTAADVTPDPGRYRWYLRAYSQCRHPLRAHHAADVCRARWLQRRPTRARSGHPRLLISFSSLCFSPSNRGST